jgi:uncharacterized membrane protein
MNNEIKTSNNSARSIRIIGNIVVAIGVIILLYSQFMETSVAPDYANIDIETARSLPERIVNFELIAYKLNYLILGGLLIAIGLKLSLISNKTISEIKQESISTKPINEEIIREALED